MLESPQMPSAEFIIEHEGITYSLDLEGLDDGGGSPRLDWTNQYYEIPPLTIQSVLWTYLLEHHAAAFLGAIGRDRLRLAASCLNNQNVPAVALPIIEQFLADHPRDQWALSVLCSVLRKLGRASEAIARTDMPGHTSSALATSRAAAFCDMGDAAMAKKEANKAMAISKGTAAQELIAVYTRIKAGGCGRR